MSDHRLRELVTRLRGYGQHPRLCRSQWRAGGSDIGPCDCGLDDVWDELSALLAEAECLRLWYPAELAPRDGSAFRAFGPLLIHADFNPWGQVEACFDGEQFIGAVWDGQHDTWTTRRIEFTHWQPMPPKPIGFSTSEEAERPTPPPEDDTRDNESEYIWGGSVCLQPTSPADMRCPFVAADGRRCALARGHRGNHLFDMLEPPTPPTGAAVMTMTAGSSDEDAADYADAMVMQRRFDAEQAERPTPPVATSDARTGYIERNWGKSPTLAERLSPNNEAIRRSKLEILDEVERIVGQHVIPGHAAGGVITGGIFAKLAELRAHLKGSPQ